jgi:olefin beta-lactone synthetase
MNLFNSLKDTAIRFANQTAIEDKANDRQVNYAEFMMQVEAVAAQLDHHGIQKGHNVLLFWPVSIELYVLMCALFKLGAKATFVEQNQPLSVIEKQIERLNPDAFVSNSKRMLSSFFSAALKNITLKFNFEHSSVSFSAFTFGYCKRLTTQATHAHTMVAELSANTDAIVTFSRGSTGQLKAIAYSHEFLFTQCLRLKNTLQLQAQQKDVSTLPIYILANLLVGVCSVITSKTVASPEKVDGYQSSYWAKDSFVTRMSASPAFYQQWLQVPNLTVESITHAYVSSAPVLPSLLHQLRSIFPNAELTAFYGANEADHIASFTYSNLQDGDVHRMKTGKGLLAGDVIDGTKVIIVDSDKLHTIVTPSDLSCACVHQGSVGEILVSGDPVVQGYWQGIGNQSNKVWVTQGDHNKTLWHRTGDMGYFDQDQKLWLLGRKAAVIHHNNTAIYPFAVEVAVKETLGVDAALVSHKKNMHLVLAGFIDETHLSAIEAQFDWLTRDHIVTVAHLPKAKRHNSKIDYAALKALL